MSAEHIAHPHGMREGCCIECGVLACRDENGRCEACRPAWQEDQEEAAATWLDAIHGEVGRAAA